ncbi:lycopene cyclase family protein [Algibacter mikhailovii]|uniref:lycopene cyclase family protein n=1 Tax=Algibacter mikhailovii TaxID=425498 RepID=UPI00249512D6|nr:lycopene cyclase family protein [Algibacter mikhailovii]
MSNISYYDYIIIGNGLAGLQLALKMAEDHFFDSKTIALIDPSNKNTNDKTWSFWEKDDGQWKSIIHKTWQRASVLTNQKKIDLKLKPYYYKSIKSIDFYNDAKAKLNACKNITFIREKVISLEESHTPVVKTINQHFSGSHVFDSRVPEAFSFNLEDSISIIQHFKGWVIKTEDDVFDERTLTMMDYRLKDGNQTTFTYILPFSKTEALVEFTYFTSDLVNEKTYDHYLKTYIKDFLKIETYQVIETETGQIAMTNFSFEKFNTKYVTKIGTGGGWVKSSTGYSFKNTEKKIKIILANLKSDRLASKGLFKKRFQFYDKIFLKVLKDDNHKGEWIFQQFYDKNTIQTMFRFLDEDSSFIEELKIMWSLFSWSFIKSFFKTL